MGRIGVITGGARSGKSRYALKWAGRSAGKRYFIATAEPFDGEMHERIQNHRLERGESFETIEEPVDLAGVLRSIPQECEVAILDCLAVWLGNLMHRRGDGSGDCPEVAEFLGGLGDLSFDLILVTSEVGMGIVPENPLARRFRDEIGRLNQEVASRADRVVLMASGLPVHLKGEEA
jgi:adenosylcobinamide kinase/adenosylcobinamide-phosphate guanylyltransferase